MSKSIVIVQELSGVVSAMDTALFPVLSTHLDCQYGSSKQIIQELLKLGQGIDTSNGIFPLVAIFQPFKETLGVGYYAKVKIPKIVIAVSSNATDSAKDRYTNTFIPILYPIYEEFKKQLSKWPTIVEQDPEFIPHTKLDNPGSAPPASVAKQFNYYVDAIEIYDLQLTFQLDSNC